MPKLETAVRLSDAECREAILADTRARARLPQIIFNRDSCVAQVLYSREETLTVLTEAAKKAAGVKGVTSSTCVILYDGSGDMTGADVRFANIKSL